MNGNFQINPNARVLVQQQNNLPNPNNGEPPQQLLIAFLGNQNENMMQIAAQRLGARIVHGHLHGGHGIDDGMNLGNPAPPQE